MGEDILITRTFSQLMVESSLPQKCSNRVCTTQCFLQVLLNSKLQEAQVYRDIRAA